MKHDKLDKFLIIIAILVNLALAVITLLWLFTDAFLHFKMQLKTSNYFGLDEKATYALFAAGVLGGSFYCLRAMYQRLGEGYTPVNGNVADPTKILNIKVWFYWYLYRPLQGGILALILLALINSHFLVTDNVNEKTISSFYTHVALGFLAGFGTHELIHKIEELIRVLFAKSRSTGSTSADKVKENEGKQS